MLVLVLVLIWGGGNGRNPLPCGVGDGEREDAGEMGEVPGAPAYPVSVGCGSSGVAVGRKLLGGGSPVIEYASVIGTIEKVIVYV